MSNDRIDVSGSINAAWTSDLSDTGETVAATESERGAVETKIFPPEVDPDELTDLQREVVFTAALNPEYSTAKVGEVIGKDGGYVRATLSRTCPEWYDETFKQAGSEGVDGNPFLKAIAASCDNCGEEPVVHDPVDDVPKIRCRCTVMELRPLPPNWVRSQ